MFCFVYFVQMGYQQSALRCCRQTLVSACHYIAHDIICTVSFFILESWAQHESTQLNSYVCACVSGVMLSIKCVRLLMTKSLSYYMCVFYLCVICSIIAGWMKNVMYRLRIARIDQSRKKKRRRRLVPLKTRP